MLLNRQPNKRLNSPTFAQMTAAQTTPTPINRSSQTLRMSNSMATSNVSPQRTEMSLNTPSNRALSVKWSMVKPLARPSVTSSFSSSSGAAKPQTNNSFPVTLQVSCASHSLRDCWTRTSERCRAMLRVPPFASAAKISHPEPTRDVIKLTRQGAKTLAQSQEAICSLKVV